MRELGVHQGLAPVLDVVRDPRWGRVEECIAEDPYLVGTIGSAYVRGLQSAGVHATLKHFVGYSGSQAGRNFAPVHAGPRELADVFLVPFEMARRRGRTLGDARLHRDRRAAGGRRPGAAHRGAARPRGASTGPSWRDYYSVSRSCTSCTASRPTSATRPPRRSPPASTSSCPTGDAYLDPLAEAVRSGAVDEALVDRAVPRALAQKAELGLLDATFGRRASGRDRPRRRRAPRPGQAARRGVGRPALQRRHPAAALARPAWR